MKKHIRLYGIFLRLNFSKLVAYRGNFVNSVFTSLLWAVFSVVSIALLTSRNPRIFGWSRDELLLLTSVYSVVIGLFHVLFTRNLEQISRIAHRGQLDGILLKPVDAQFYLSSSIVNYSSIPRVISAILLTAYLLWYLNIHITILDISQFILIGIVGIIFLYSLWYTLMTVTIWQSQLFNLSDLLFHVTDSAKYPSEMYVEFRYYITLFLLPLSFIVTLPTKVLLHKADLLQTILLISLAVFMLIVSRVCGKFVLRYYSSASS